MDIPLASVKFKSMIFPSFNIRVFINKMNNSTAAYSILLSGSLFNNTISISVVIHCYISLF